MEDKYRENYYKSRRNAAADSQIDKLKRWGKYNVYPLKWQEVNQKLNYLFIENESGDCSNCENDKGGNYSLSDFFDKRGKLGNDCI